MVDGRVLDSDVPQGTDLKSYIHITPTSKAFSSCSNGDIWLDREADVYKRQVYGFLGPNGAGKSTTMNIMTGCLSATKGHVQIDGYDIFEDAGEAKKRIGYLPEQPPLYMNETPEEYLRFVGEAKGLRGAEPVSYTHLCAWAKTAAATRRLRILR